MLFEKQKRGKKEAVLKFGTVEGSCSAVGSLFTKKLAF